MVLMHTGFGGTRLIDMLVGRSPEELCFPHPYLALRQVHSALAYFWDHREELDHDIQRRLEVVTKLRRASFKLNYT